MAHLVIGLAWFGCGAPPLESWDGCLAEGTVLVPDPDFGVAPQRGAGTLLTVGTSWGDVPFLTDHGQHRDLVVALPADVQLRTYDLSTLDRRLAERSWRTDRVDGQVRVVELGRDHARVQIDAEATAPDGATRRVAGQVRVRRGKGPHCDP